MKASFSVVIYSLLPIILLAQIQDEVTIDNGKYLLEVDVVPYYLSEAKLYEVKGDGSKGD